MPISGKHQTKHDISRILYRGLRARSGLYAGKKIHQNTEIDKAAGMVEAALYDMTRPKQRKQLF